MVQINVTSKAMQNGDNVTSYTNTVGTAQETFTFLTAQETVILSNKGSKNINYTIGSNTGVLTPSTSVTVTGSFDSLVLSAEQGTQAFEVWADEVGTSGVSSGAIATLDGKVTDLTTSLAQIAKQSSSSNGSNDTTAIQALLNSVTAGSRIFIPSGKIYYFTQLTVPDGVEIFGHGTLKMIANTNGNGLKVGNNSIIRDITIDGSGNTFAYGVGLIKMQGNNSAIRGVTVNNGTVVLNISNDCDISKNTLTNSHIQVLTGSSYNRIKDNKIQPPTGTNAISLNGNDGILLDNLISNNHLYNCERMGIEAITNANGTKIFNNTIEVVNVANQSYGFGISVNGSFDCKISKNSIRKSYSDTIGNYGIELVNASSTKVLDNTVDGFINGIILNGQETARLYGVIAKNNKFINCKTSIYIFRSVYFCKITENEIYITKPNGVGINIEGTAGITSGININDNIISAKEDLAGSILKGIISSNLEYSSISRNIISVIATNATNNSYGAIMLASGKGLTIDGNNLTGNGINGTGIFTFGGTVPPGSIITNNIASNLWKGYSLSNGDYEFFNNRSNNNANWNTLPNIPSFIYDRFNTYYMSALPTSGVFNVGDRIINTAPTSGGYAGWVCTTSGDFAGTPPVFKTFGLIS